ncbi:MAG: hypothetical protein E7063_01270 [Spirochaetaceae bacterium]|nr:hypothetical protein [Spirochaetaceae bacterium]
MKKKFSYICIFLLWIFVILPLWSEQLGSTTYGYSLDLPEGFVLVDSSGDGKGYQFQNIIYPVDILIKIYDTSTFDSATAALNSTLIKLSAKAEVSQVDWRNTDCIIAKFSMSLNGKNNEGWGVCAALPEKKGYFLMLSYAESNNNQENSTFSAVEPIILSAIDSLYIDRGSFYSAGPVTTFAFPESEEQSITLNIAGKEIPTVIYKEDAIANEFVIEREFYVLKLFADTELWVQAWQRYYRQIYRDAYHRLKRPAFDIYAALYRSDNLERSKKEPAEITKELLNWVQSFEYQRDTINSDFVSLPAVLSGESGSDCDSRSMLLAILLRQMNIETVIFVSPIYSHAMLGVNLNLPGAKIQVDGTEFLLGETTDSVELGLVAKEMSVTENWLPVVFP